ncbi:MAG: hypothetical protein DRH56_04135 [Deltaproteobacteria bacterium]|nr:MAG: hypothetical protein DRH56_04135 [Deltaproteobacteria bacterium]
MSATPARRGGVKSDSVITAAFLSSYPSTSNALMTRYSPFLSDARYQLPCRLHVSFHTPGATLVIRLSTSMGVHTIPLADFNRISRRARSSLRRASSSGVSQ